jgi:hypothetical protein
MAIMRRYQMDNLRQYDREKWPEFAELVGYRSRAKREKNYYESTDYFYELGEYLSDLNEERQRKYEADKKKGERQARNSGRTSKRSDNELALAPNQNP